MTWPTWVAPVAAAGGLSGLPAEAGSAIFARPKSKTLTMPPGMLYLPARRKSILSRQNAIAGVLAGGEVTGGRLPAWEKKKLFFFDKEEDVLV
jgi:hypothetical protein